MSCSSQPNLRQDREWQYTRQLIGLNYCDEVGALTDSFPHPNLPPLESPQHEIFRPLARELEPIIGNALHGTIFQKPAACMYPILYIGKGLLQDLYRGNYFENCDKMIGVGPIPTKMRQQILAKPKNDVDIRVMLEVPYPMPLDAVIWHLRVVKEKIRVMYPGKIDESYEVFHDDNLFILLKMRINDTHLDLVFAVQLKRTSLFVHDDLFLHLNPYLAFDEPEGLRPLGEEKNGWQAYVDRHAMLLRVSNVWSINQKGLIAWASALSSGVFPVEDHSAALIHSLTMESEETTPFRSLLTKMIAELAARTLYHEMNLFEKLHLAITSLFLVQSEKLTIMDQAQLLRPYMVQVSASSTKEYTPFDFLLKVAGLISTGRLTAEECISLFSLAASMHDHFPENSILDFSFRTLGDRTYFKMEMQENGCSRVFYFPFNPPKIDAGDLKTLLEKGNDVIEYLFPYPPHPLSIPKLVEIIELHHWEPSDLQPTLPIPFANPKKTLNTLRKVSRASENLPLRYQQIFLAVVKVLVEQNRMEEGIDLLFSGKVLPEGLAKESLWALRAQLIKFPLTNLSSKHVYEWIAEGISDKNRIDKVMLVIEELLTNSHRLEPDVYTILLDAVPTALKALIDQKKPAQALSLWAQARLCGVDKNISIEIALSLFHLILQNPSDCPPQQMDALALTLENTIHIQDYIVQLLNIQQTELAHVWTRKLANRIAQGPTPPDVKQIQTLFQWMERSGIDGVIKADVTTLLLDRVLSSGEIENTSHLIPFLAPFCRVPPSTKSIEITLRILKKASTTKIPTEIITFLIGLLPTAGPNRTIAILKIFRKFRPDINPLKTSRNAVIEAIKAWATTEPSEVIDYLNIHAAPPTPLYSYLLAEETKLVRKLIKDAAPRQKSQLILDVVRKNPQSGKFKWFEELLKSGCYELALGLLDSLPIENTIKERRLLIPHLKLDAGLVQLEKIRNFLGIKTVEDAQLLITLLNQSRAGSSTDKASTALRNVISTPSTFETFYRLMIALEPQDPKAWKLLFENFTEKYSIDQIMIAWAYFATSMEPSAEMVPLLQSTSVHLAKFVPLQDHPMVVSPEYFFTDFTENTETNAVTFKKTLTTIFAAKKEPLTQEELEVCHRLYVSLAPHTTGPYLQVRLMLLEKLISHGFFSSHAAIASLREFNASNETLSLFVKTLQMKLNQKPRFSSNAELHDFIAVVTHYLELVRKNNKGSVPLKFQAVVKTLLSFQNTVLDQYCLDMIVELLKSKAISSDLLEILKFMLAVPQLLSFDTENSIYNDPKIPVKMKIQYLERTCQNLRCYRSVEINQTRLSNVLTTVIVDCIKHDLMHRNELTKLIIDEILFIMKLCANAYDPNNWIGSCIEALINAPKKPLGNPSLVYLAEKVLTVLEEIIPKTDNIILTALYTQDSESPNGSVSTAVTPTMNQANKASESFTEGEKMLFTHASNAIDFVYKILQSMIKRKDSTLTPQITQLLCRIGMIHILLPNKDFKCDSVLEYILKINNIDKSYKLLVEQLIVQKKITSGSSEHLNLLLHIRDYVGIKKTFPNPHMTLRKPLPERTTRPVRGSKKALPKPDATVGEIIEQFITSMPGSIPGNWFPTLLSLQNEYFKAIPPDRIFGLYLHQINALKTIDSSFAVLSAAHFIRIALIGMPQVNAEVDKHFFEVLVEISKIFLQQELPENAEEKTKHLQHMMSFCTTILEHIEKCRNVHHLESTSDFYYTTIKTLILLIKEFTSKHRPEDRISLSKLNDQIKRVVFFIPQTSLLKAQQDLFIQNQLLCYKDFKSLVPKRIHHLTRAASHVLDELMVEELLEGSKRDTQEPKAPTPFSSGMAATSSSTTPATLPDHMLPLHLRGMPIVRMFRVNPVRTEYIDVNGHAFVVLE